MEETELVIYFYYFFFNILFLDYFCNLIYFFRDKNNIYDPFINFKYIVNLFIGKCYELSRLSFSFVRSYSLNLNYISKIWMMDYPKMIKTENYNNERNRKRSSKKLWKYLFKIFVEPIDYHHSWKQILIRYSCCS